MADDAAITDDQQDVPDSGDAAARVSKPRWSWYRRFKWTVRIAFLVGLAIILIMGCDGCFYFPSREIV